jgi:hypothetical protein
MRTREMIAAILFGSLLLLPAAGRIQADSVVVFNEVMYHPESASAGEWIELYNQLAIDVDLSGWSIRGGVDYVFPEGTFLPGGGYLIVADDSDALGDIQGLASVFRSFTGRLSNAGERLELVNNSDRVMDRLDYDDGGDWPLAPDGSGVSLAKTDPGTASVPAGNWGWSDQVGGTPGSVNFPAAVPPTAPETGTGRRWPPVS